MVEPLRPAQGEGFHLRFSLKTVAALCVAAVAMVFAGGAVADTATIDFEAYELGSIDGQNGWSSTGQYDREVVLSGGVAGFGAKSLRISNAVTSGSFGDQTFSPSLAEQAGETGKNYFEASWQFASTVPGAEQPGLSAVASPDRGDGARMSWIQMADTPTGLAVNFSDYQGGAAPGCGGAFVPTELASGLERTAPHTIKVRMWFVPGPSNDVVQVLVDNTLRHTGTSWEDYFRSCEGNPTRNVDSILFRTGGTAAPDTAGKGFLIDNLSLASSNATVAGGCAFDVTGTTWTLLADCTTDTTISIPTGVTLDGDGHSITAVDPAGDHFRGAVVRNGGETANVTDVEITASGLADVCDGGADRLRGILLDGASGSITTVSVHGVRQGLSGCQEGNAIEARNVDANAGSRLAVMISDTIVVDYMKNGITTNGNLSATIERNSVMGDGPVGYIAQNGIQVGFGASALVQGNAVSGNFYTGADLACGLLIFDAQGVRQSKNAFSGNERDVCNFGRGGGKVLPASS
jgi:hypothetical protein